MNYDLLLHVDADATPIMNLAFNNAANYKAALPDEEFSMVMVANGPAVKLLTKENETLATRAKELAASGLSIRVCNNALNTFHIDPKDLWPECTVIPAGVVEIVKLQREGFAYIKP